MGLKNKRHDRRLGVLRAKLTFDDGRAENPIDRIIGFNTEKKKGLQMLERIEDRFNISQKDRDKFFQDKMEELRAIPGEVSEQFNSWTRDERGNIVSPFRSKKIV